jgi:hypothetical protein
MQLKDAQKELYDSVIATAIMLQSRDVIFSSSGFRLLFLLESLFQLLLIKHSACHI